MFFLYDENVVIDGVEELVGEFVGDFELDWKMIDLFEEVLL